MFARLFSLFAVVALIGCNQPKVVPVEPKAAAVANPPANQDKLILYAIDGLVNEPPGGTVTDDNYFRGYAILGEVEITEAAEQQKILKAIEDGFKESDGNVASCFWPRHGVHFVSQGKAIDYVICYECGSTGIYTEEGTTGKPTAATHQAVLTAPLTAAGIKLAPSIEELGKAK